MNPKTLSKIAVLAAGALAVILFKVMELDQYLTLEYLKSSQDQFAQLYSQHPFEVIGSYMLLYIMATALSVPGAAIFTLAGGAMFGLSIGSLAVSFASTIGATLACFVARFLLRDWVQNKFGDRLTAINNGIEREGAFYLFTLRLIPIFPFFMINLAMGMTKMPLFTYYWISQLGMLPATVVYVNAGKELAKIDSLSSILSPSLLASFIILGLFPISVKKLMALFRTKTAA